MTISTKQLELVYEFAEVGILVCDSDGKILDSNSAVDMIFNRKLKGKNIMLLLPDYIKQKHPTLIKEFFQSGTESKSMGERMPIDAIGVNNKPLKLRISLINSTSEGNEQQVIAIIENITDLKNLQSRFERTVQKTQILKDVLVAQKSIGKYFQLAALAVTISFVWFAISTQFNFKLTKEGVVLDATPRDSDQIERIMKNIPTLLGLLGAAGFVYSGKKKENDVISHTDDELKEDGNDDDDLM